MSAISKVILVSAFFLSSQVMAAGYHSAISDQGNTPFMGLEPAAPSKEAHMLEGTDRTERFENKDGEPYNFSKIGPAWPSKEASMMAIASRDVQSKNTRRGDISVDKIFSSLEPGYPSKEAAIR
ncbi:hypothetical protein [Marinobacterium jannaschii]|uniref:hypothetical protein n=1 Tax=Marinobacterium jannaschii TaxID=64970 RepID=UPI0012EB1C74|nr:hypothetical protein [Marinobacterium jannaschii]